MTDALRSPNAVCPACNQGLVCGMVAGTAPCWCDALPHQLPVPASAMTRPGHNPPSTGCLCPTCLQLRLNVPPTALTDPD